MPPNNSALGGKTFNLKNQIFILVQCTEPEIITKDEKIFQTMCRLIRQSRLDKSAGFGEEGFRISRVLRSREATSKTRRSRHILQKSEAILQNVRDIRSFSGTKWKKNLGEGRAEPRTVYPLLYAPSETKCSESAARFEAIAEKVKFEFFVIK